MDKILFVVLFAMLVAWLYSLCGQEDDGTCTNEKNSESSAGENVIETESPGYKVEQEANPCS